MGGKEILTLPSFEKLDLGEQNHLASGYRQSFLSELFRQRERRVRDDVVDFFGIVLSEEVHPANNTTSEPIISLNQISRDNLTVGIMFPKHLTDMKMDKVAGSGNDEFYTPEYAIAPLYKYLPPPP